MLKFEFDASGLNAGLDEIVKASEASVRVAAQAGAQVLYDETRLRAPVAKRAYTNKRGKRIVPGALKASIYQVYSKDNSTEQRATYHVSWNAKKAPHGHLVEFGTSRAPAHPFLRPAFDARQADALQASRVAMFEALDKVLS